ncbi:hypothetical protein I3843_07G134800 [Carya illinoinensis]|nr:hypothetical protein I3843_07G134800 [Carya illinoinensis]
MGSNKDTSILESMRAFHCAIGTFQQHDEFLCVFEQKEKLFSGGQDEFNSPNSDLKLAYAFINECRGKHNEHELLTEARRQLRDIANEAEDVMDALKVENLWRRNLVWKISCYPMMCHDAAKKIEGFNHKINKILDTVQRYEAKATPVAAVDVALERQYRRFVEEEDVLMEGDSKLGFISIIGMGGLGKTTLAWKIYNTLIVKSHFVCRLWVHASYQFRTRDLLLEMLDRLATPESDESMGALEDTRRIKRRRMNGIEGMSKEELKKKVVQILGRKEFLIKDESWELFSKKLFQGGKLPPKLETLGRQIAKSWASLTAVEEKTHRTLSKYIGNDILSLSYTLLSQHLKSCFLYFGVYPEEFEIPIRQLIQLWIAEGFIQHTGSTNIEVVAEDYLVELNDQSLIQVASSRTNGRAKTCRIHALLQCISIYEGKEERFLEVFGHVNLLSENKSRRISIQCSTPCYISSNFSHGTCARSLLFFGQEKFGDDSNKKKKKKRPAATLIQTIGKWVHKNFSLVRVLNFGHINIYSIPSNIEELIYLRYLRIKSDVLKVIPASICFRRDMRVLGKLPCLYILKLQSCLLSSKLTFFADSFPCLEVLKLEKLNIKIWKQRRRTMPSLKHLVIKRCTDLNMLPS